MKAVMMAAGVVRVWPGAVKFGSGQSGRLSEGQWCRGIVP